MDWDRVQTIKGSETLTSAETADVLGENAWRFYDLLIRSAPL
jgi:hypothetical protein